MSIATSCTPSRQAGVRAASQAPASPLARPSTCPSRPWRPVRSVNPVCHLSVTCSNVPVSGSSAKRGLPRRVSSIPNAATGCGSAGSIAVARSVNAADTTGQDNPRSRPAWATVRPARATAVPAASRSRAVIRAPQGTCGIDSVNDERAHSGSRQRHRRLRHTNRDGTGNATSRGPVSTQPFTDVDTDRHDGHTATASAVDTCTTRQPSGSSSTRSTTTPSNPTNNVVSSCTPVVLLDRLPRLSHDHEGLRAPYIRGSHHPEPTPLGHQPGGANLPLPGQDRRPSYPPSAGRLSTVLDIPTPCRLQFFSAHGSSRRR